MSRPQIQSGLALGARMSDRGGNLHDGNPARGMAKGFALGGGLAEVTTPNEDAGEAHGVSILGIFGFVSAHRQNCHQRGGVHPISKAVSMAV